MDRMYNYDVVMFDVYKIWWMHMNVWCMIWWLWWYDVLCMSFSTYWLKVTQVQLIASKYIKSVGSSYIMEFLDAPLKDEKYMLV